MRKVKLIYLIGIFFIIVLFVATTGYSPHMSIDQYTDKWPTDWRPCGGYVDEIKFVIFTETEIPLAMLALQNGDIDAYDERILQEYLPSLVSDPNIEVTFTPSIRYRVLTLNCERFPTNLTAFRRAMAFGFDKYRANVECIGGFGSPQDSYIPLIATEWEVESVLPNHFYEADYISGNASLENAGFIDLDGDGWREYDADDSGTWTIGDLDDDEYAEGGIMELFASAGYDPSIRACDIMVDGLKAMGVRATTLEMDFMTIFEELWAGRCWVACWTEVVPFVNTVKILYDNFASGGQYNLDPYNYFHFNNATINAVLENMIATSDIDEVKQYAREASLMLAFEQPQIVCYNDVNIGAHRNDRFDGWFEFAGAGVSSGDNWACATKIHLKESLGGPYGGTFSYCLSDNLGTLNPYLQTTGYEATVIQYIYEALVNVDPFTWDFEPGLAYDWDIEETTAYGDILNGLKFTYYLYENETWHDGTPFTAVDVNTSIYQWMACPRSGPEMDHIYKTEMPDDYTIIVYSNTTGFFEFADTQVPYVIPDHIFNFDHVANITAFNPTPAQMVGTGPYAMAAHVPGEYIRLERHQDWRWDIRDIKEETTTTMTIEPTETSFTEIPCENNPPEVTISGIEDEGTYSGTLTVKISATDESDIVQAEITIRSGTIDETEDVILELSEGKWKGEFKLDTTDFPDDTYRMIIRVYDACENMKIIRLDITIDNEIDQSSNTTGTEPQEVPTITPGYGVLMSLGTITIIFWRRRRT